MFGYDNGNENTANPENRFRIEYFNIMVNEIKSNSQTKFESFAEFVDKFGFVFEMSNLKKMSKEELLKHCQDLKAVSSVGNNCDFDCYKVFEELKVLSSAISDIRDIFKFIVQRKLSVVFPNVFILLRIVMDEPVTSASTEKSFSRLKLINAYLRTTMAQGRLTGLTILSIENVLASVVNYSGILGSFSSRESRERSLW
jgi:hypothetical protein